MCLSLQDISNVGFHDVIKDSGTGAEEMQRYEGELADQNNKDKIYEDKSEWICTFA